MARPADAAPVAFLTAADHDAGSRGGRLHEAVAEHVRAVDVVHQTLGDDGLTLGTRNELDERAQHGIAQLRSRTPSLQFVLERDYAWNREDDQQRCDRRRRRSSTREQLAGNPRDEQRESSGWQIKVA